MFLILSRGACNYSQILLEHKSLAWSAKVYIPRPKMMSELSLNCLSFKIEKVNFLKNVLQSDVFNKCFLWLPHNLAIEVLAAASKALLHRVPVRFRSFDAFVLGLKCDNESSIFYWTVPLIYHYYESSHYPQVCPPVHHLLSNHLTLSPLWLHRQSRKKRKDLHEYNVL